MSNDFDEFIASQKKNDLDGAAKQFEEAAQKKAAREVDERFWNPASCVDKDGNGRAVVRLLPAPNSAESPFVTILKHSQQRLVQGQKRYYIENSRKTIGLDDPVYDYNGDVMNRITDKEERKKYMIARQKRYICNIMIIENDVAPDQVGKVFLWDFGGQIWDKIEAKMFPTSPKDPKQNPFNIFEGMNLIVRSYKKAVGMNDLPQYDKSEFMAPSPMGKDPVKVIKSIFNQLVDLNEFLDPKNFKPYDVLQKQLDYVLGKTAAAPAGEASAAAAEKTAAPKAEKEAVAKEEEKDAIPDFGVPEKTATAEEPAKQPVAESGDDDFFSRFK